MDAKYIAEIKAREQAATPGPWKHEYTVDGAYVHDGDAVVCRCTQLGDEAAFIAHARTDIPALIAALREVQDENCKLIAEAERLRSCKCVDKCKLVCMLDEYDKVIVERDTLKKALELACDSKFRYMPKPDYFIHQAQEQEGKK